MPQEILRQNTFTGGELDPQLVARRDLAAYPRSLATMQDMIPTAQGPARRRPGAALVDQVRGPLVPVDISSGLSNPSAPNGGDISSAIGNEASALVTTTAMGATDGYVVLEFNFTVAPSVSAVDLSGFAAVPLGTGGGTVIPPTPPDYPWNPIRGGGRTYIP